MSKYLHRTVRIWLDLKTQFTDTESCVASQDFFLPLESVLKGLSHRA